jgi:hypothetical protein
MDTSKLPIAAKSRGEIMPIGFRRNGSPIWPIAGGASPLQVANPAQQRVSRNPQTTAPPGGGPFTRQTRVSRLFGFSANPLLGELVASPLKPVPGYLSYLDVTVVVTGGTGSAAVAAADAPFSIIRNVQVIDAFGNPIASYSGFELALLNVYGGQGGFFSPLAGGNYVPVMTTAGNFSFHFVIPFELFAGFCSIPAANASAVPNLRIQLGTSADVYATPPTGMPTGISVTVEECYNSIGLTNPNAEPPDNGASHQWFSQPAPQGIGSAGIIDSQLPPLGGWLTTLILVGRDSLGARADAVLAAALSTQTALWIDNVPEFQELFGTRKAWMDDFFEIPTTAQVGADLRTGIVVYTYRQAAATFGPINALDTGDGWVDTNPGTIVQYKSTSGAIANAPGKLTVLSGRVYTPSGVPYTHLSE